MNLLHESWMRVTNGVSRNDEFIDLVCRYSDSSRRYHNLEHIRDMLQGLWTLNQQDNIDLHRAIWWHDAIYDTKRKDNEEQSAKLMAHTLGLWGESEADIERVSALIAVTKSHNAPQGDMDATVLIDLDLNILAAHRAKYDFYALNVREEYGWVDQAAYAYGRSDFLQSMLNREQIFATRRPAEEAQARANLVREMAHWQQGCPM